MDSLEYTFRDGTTTHDVVEWARTFEDHDYRRIANDEFTLPDGTWQVSTIWQGMPEMFGATRVFETAVFHNEGLVAEAHYPTEQSAIDGHAEVLAAVKNGTLDQVPGLER